MPEKCKDCCSRLFCMSVAEVNGEDFETMVNKKDCRKRVFTNADRIRAMSDDELAVFIRAVIMAEDCPVTGCDCDECFFKEPCFNGPKWHSKETEWLKQPAEE